MLTNVTEAGILWQEEIVTVRIVDDGPKIPQDLGEIRRANRISLRRMARELQREGLSYDHTYLSKIEQGKLPAPAGLLVGYVKVLERLWEEDGFRLGKRIEIRTQTKTRA